MALVLGDATIQGYGFRRHKQARLKPLGSHVFIYIPLGFASLGSDQRRARGLRVMTFTSCHLSY